MLQKEALFGVIFRELTSGFKDRDFYNIDLLSFFSKLDVLLVSIITEEYVANYDTMSYT